MKGILNSVSIALTLGILSFAAGRVRADLEVSTDVRIHAVADFHAPLTPHGAWIEVGTYGRCWRPAHVAVGWRPYCDGEWVWTDCGWYWVSDEPWAWACYHYGWWTLDPTYGWIWVPGIEWAPAWVSWRVGGGYCGWAPLPPRGVVLASAVFVFVEERRFHERVRPSTVIVNNTTIIKQTTVVNNVKRETRVIAGAGPQKVVVNEGPNVATIQKATGKTFSPTPIREVVRQTPVPQTATRSAETGGKAEAKPTPVPETKPAPPDTQRLPPETRPSPPDKGQPPGRGIVVPGPDRAPVAPPRQPGIPSGPPGKGRDKN
jgi:hypothetical protein